MFPVLRRISSRHSLKSLQNVSRQKHISNVYQNTPIFATNCTNNLQTIRFKSKKTSKIPQPEVTESEQDVSEDETLDSVQDKHSKLMRITVASSRVDAVVKAALGISRNKIDVMFYENRIRVNGEKILKKNINVQEGDEVDLIKGFSPTNPDHLNVARIEVLSATAEDDKVIVKIRRFKSETVENYGEHNSWKE